MEIPHKARKTNSCLCVCVYKRVLLSCIKLYYNTVMLVRCSIGLSQILPTGSNPLLGSNPLISQIILSSIWQLSRQQLNPGSCQREPEGIILSLSFWHIHHVASRAVCHSLTAMGVGGGRCMIMFDRIKTAVHLWRRPLSGTTQDESGPAGLKNAWKLN